MQTHSKTKTVNVSRILKTTGMSSELVTSGPVIIEQTAGMYPHKRRLTDNWSYFTAAGFGQLYEDLVWPDSVAIIGVGSGVEGIAALQVFGYVTFRRLIITDVDEGVVNGAKRNIERNLVKPSRIVLQPLVGSFCEPLTEQGIKVGLIHANIPNLPAPEGVDLSGGAEKGTFLKPTLYTGYKPPKKFTKWALGAQYAYVQSAVNALLKKGSVLTEVGGRVPLSLLKELFTENGF